MLPGLQDPVPRLKVSNIQSLSHPVRVGSQDCKVSLGPGLPSNLVGPIPGLWNPGNAHRSKQDHIKLMKSIEKLQPRSIQAASLHAPRQEPILMGLPVCAKAKKNCCILLQSIKSSSHRVLELGGRGGSL